MPQASLSLPSRQRLSPSQQPRKHVSWLHGPCVPPPPVPGIPHMPELHVVPLAQVTQVTPFEPHEVADEFWQVVPSQQPLQFAGPQVTAETHALLKQLWPTGQTLHAAPPLPQLTFEMPGEHPASPKHPRQAPASHWPAELQI